MTDKRFQIYEALSISLPWDFSLFDIHLMPQNKVLCFIDSRHGRDTITITGASNAELSAKLNKAIHDQYHSEEKQMAKTKKKAPQLDSEDRKELKKMGKAAFIQNEKKDIKIAKKGK